MINRRIPGAQNQQCQYETLLEPVKDSFLNHAVLDVGCYTGYSTCLIKSYNATSCIGLDVVKSFVDTAKANFENKDVKFLCGSLFDHTLIDKLVKEHDVVCSFGNFYHLYNHFDLIKLFCQSHVKYLILDSLYGPETPDPTMFWTFKNLIMQEQLIAKGTPNISWITKACECFNFKLDYVHRYYSITDFEKVTDHEANKRMTLRFFNSNVINKSKYFLIDDVWQWDDNNLKQKV